MRIFIKQRLENKGMNVTELSKRLGISRQTIYSELNSDMRLSSLLKMADAMGYQLCFYDPDEKKVYRVEK